jgi:hypothetical protein
MPPQVLVEEPKEEKPGSSICKDQKEGAIYTHSDGRPEEVTIVKALTDGEGGGYTIFIPSLGRERLTVEDRLLTMKSGDLDPLGLEGRGDPQAKLGSSTEDIKQMSVKDMKVLIKQAGLSYADCSEKREIQARAEQAQVCIAQGQQTHQSSEASATRPSAATPGEADVKQENGAVRACSASHSSTEEGVGAVNQMPVKEMKVLIEQAGLSYADCSEKREIQARAVQAQERIAKGQQAHQSSEASVSYPSTATPRASTRGKVGRSVVTEEVWQNHRYVIGVRPWGDVGYLKAGDPSKWSHFHIDGGNGTSKAASFGQGQHPVVKLPIGWTWDGAWEVDYTHCKTSEHGWSYGRTWKEINDVLLAGESCPNAGLTGILRRRKWVRVRKYAPGEADPKQENGAVRACSASHPSTEKNVGAVSQMSVKEMKVLIEQAGLSYADCSEKREIQARAEQAQEHVAKRKRKIGTAKTGGMAAAAAESVGKGIAFAFEMANAAKEIIDASETLTATQTHWIMPIFETIRRAGKADHYPKTEAGLLTLTKLDLCHCNLSGIIPPQIGMLKSLQELNLKNCKLIGTIPPQIGKLKNLRVLTLVENMLHGHIPYEIGSLRSLVHLNLSQLKPDRASENEESTAKAFVGTMTAFANSARLSGPIPPGIGRLLNLVYLNLQDNELDGAIPPEIGSCSMLQTLSLSNNRLTGSIPATICKLRDLQKLYLMNNQLEGFVPKVPLQPLHPQTLAH